MEKTTKLKTSYFQISINTNASKADRSIIRDTNCTFFLAANIKISSVPASLAGPSTRNRELSYY
jgi:hypothetical protein